MKPTRMDEREAALLRQMIRDAELNECLFLVRNGVPFDVAFSISPQERFAWCVIIQRFDGANFNFETMKFDKPNKA